MTQRDKLQRFRDLHAAGTFVMPNPHDIGTARLLAALGFDALATTSAGFAASLGQLDMTVTRDQLVDHVRTIAVATDLPLNVDAERCFPDQPGGITRTVELLSEAGAAGCSIEDWNPVDQRIEPIETAVERVVEAVTAAKRVGLVLTARAENHIRGVDDFEDTILRVTSYAAAGVDCVYAPGLTDLAKIKRLVDESGAPVNILLLPGGPTVAQLTDLGVRRISLGSGLSNIAFGAFAKAAKRLLEEGVLGTDEPFLTRDLSKKAFRS